MMKNARVRSLFAIFVGILIGATAGMLHWRREGPDHWSAREAAIMQQAPFVKGGLLLIGDSLAERAYVPQLCGLPVLNAGMGGAKAGDVFDVAVKAKRVMQPTITIVAIGTNDTDLETFRRDFTALVEAVEPDAVVGLTTQADFNAIISRAGRYIEPVTDLLPDGKHQTVAGRTQFVARLSEACHSP